MTALLLRQGPSTVKRTGLRGLLGSDSGLLAVQEGIKKWLNSVVE